MLSRFSKTRRAWRTSLYPAVADVTDTFGEIATPGRHSLLSLELARSEENTAFYMRGGLVF